MGPYGELVVSALGAMDDQHMLAPGLVTYSSDGKFNHGFHKSSTGLSNPYGITPYPGNSSRLLVADWGSNRTVVMQVDWSTGSANQLIPINHSGSQPRKTTWRS